MTDYEAKFYAEGKNIKPLRRHDAAVEEPREIRRRADETAE